MCLTISADDFRSCADPVGGGGGHGGWTPLENHKNIGFLRTTCPDPLKNHKATNPAFNVGQSLADDGPILANSKDVG